MIQGTSKMGDRGPGIGDTEDLGWGTYDRGTGTFNRDGGRWDLG